MPIDGCFVHYLTNELNNELSNAKINKIYMPSLLDIIIEVRTTNKQNKNLLISANLSSPRINITEHTYQVPINPPSFCMLLRKHIERGIIKTIHQVNNDRIIVLDITSSNEMGDSIDYNLIIELMGRNSNIILIKNNIIIDAVRKLFPTNEAERTIVPKAQYIYPTRSNLLNPFTETFTSLDECDGMSIKLKNYLKNQNNIIECLNQPKMPCIFTFNNKIDFYAYPLINDQINEQFNTLSNLLDKYYEKDNESNDVITYLLTKELDKKIKQLKHKISLLEDEITVSNDAIKLENEALLLKAYIYKIKKGDKEITVEDYNTGDNITIKLDPTLEPAKNLEKMFKKIKKAKTSLEYLDTAINKANEDIDYLENINFQLSISKGDEIDEIKKELYQNGFIKKNSKYLKPKKLTKPLEYIVDGLSILVGKYNTQNEYLTHKVASGNDYWFHVKDIPGSHVIVKSNGMDLTENIIRTAANIAAYYSKAKESSSVPVDYTLVKNIKKIPKEKGYHVTYKNQKTIYIDPDINLFNKYLKK